MATAEIEQWWINGFQENLGIIRKVAGWTTQQLADELGVARQTISNLETGKSPMTKLQYLALRTVFNAEIAQRENRDLAKIIKTLVDDPIQQQLEQMQSASESSKNFPEANRQQGMLSKEGMPHRPVSTKKLSVAMQALAVITGLLASGAAAGMLTYFIFPDGDSSKR